MVFIIMHGHDVCNVCVACEYMGYMCVMCMCFVLVACTISKNIPLAQISSITVPTFFMYSINTQSSNVHWMLKLQGRK